MYGLVDLWTSELAKLKNKVQPIFSSGPAPPSSPPPAQADGKRGGAPLSWWPIGGLVEALQVKSLPALHCSEASLSMLMDSFSA